MDTAARDANENKHLAIVGMIEPYKGEMGDTDELWTVNRAYKYKETTDGSVLHQKDVTRCYFFDNLDLFGPEVIEEFSQLHERGVRIVGRKKWPEIPGCEAYPLDQVVAHYDGLKYFTCTAAYLLALAIYEGYGRITLSGMYWSHDSSEYTIHVPCMNFWCGLALGMGRRLNMTGSTQLVRPWPWETGLYGYWRNKNEGLCIQTMACAYRASLGYPTYFVDSDTPRTEEEVKEDEMVKNIIVRSVEPDIGRVDLGQLGAKDKSELVTQGERA